MKLDGIFSSEFALLRDSLTREAGSEVATTKYDLNNRCESYR